MLYFYILCIQKVYDILRGDRFSVDATNKFCTKTITTSLLLLALLATTSLWFSNPNETNAGKMETVPPSELRKAVSL